MKKLIKNKVNCVGGRVHGGVGISTLPTFVSLALLLIFAFLMVFEIEVNAAETDITKRDVSELNIDFGDGSNGVYQWTGEQIKPLFNTIDSEGISWGEGVDYTVSYGENIEPGKGTITIIGLGDEGTGDYNWYGTKTFEFTIEKATNPLVNTGYKNGKCVLSVTYHDNGKYLRDIKKYIYEDDFLDNEMIKTIKNSNLKFTSSNKNIFKISDDKNSITVTGVGIAYLNFVIPETTHYKSFKGKMKVISYPPRADYSAYSMRLEKGNSFRFGVTCGLGSDECKTDFKCKIIIATSKTFKKSSIIKSYTLSKKEFNNQKIKRIKSKKFKKGQKFYIKNYTYSKLSDGRTIYGETIISKFKINKKGEIKSMKIDGEDYYSKEPYIK